MPAAAFDVGQLAGLLRRAPSICTGCATVKLVLHVDRVVTALAELSRAVNLATFGPRDSSMAADN